MVFHEIVNHFENWVTKEHKIKSNLAGGEGGGGRDEESLGTPEQLTMLP